MNPIINPLFHIKKSSPFYDGKIGRFIGYAGQNKDIVVLEDIFCPGHLIAVRECDLEESVKEITERIS